jgi:hypothetical protein
LENIEKKEFESKEVALYESQFQWFLGAALLLLFLDIFLLDRKHRGLQNLTCLTKKNNEKSTTVCLLLCAVVAFRRISNLKRKLKIKTCQKVTTNTRQNYPEAEAQYRISGSNNLHSPFRRITWVMPYREKKPAEAAFA